MKELLIINEASLPFKSLDDCNKNIDKIFDILHGARLGNLSFCRVDGYEGDWGALNYATGFEFGRWLHNIDDKDKIRQIKSVLTSLKCPLLNSNDAVNTPSCQNMMFFLESDHSTELFGLGYAHVLDKYSLSFPSDTMWLENIISITKFSDIDGVTELAAVAVKNIASKEQLDAYLKELEESRKRNKAFLADLKTQNNEYFKNLIFTESVLKSFSSSAIQYDDFNRVIDALSKLDRAISTSDNTIQLSENSGLSITGESSTTMSNKTLVRLRTFKHPDYGKIVFEDHVKNFPNFKRMHIFPDYKNKKVCIGYFGSHLSTSSS